MTGVAFTLVSKIYNWWGDDLLRSSYAHLLGGISISAQTRLCSKKRAVTREGVDFDMTLPSTLREVFKYENKYIFSRKNSPGSFKLTLQTAVSRQDQRLPL